MINFGIVVERIMMKQVQAFDLGLESQRNHVVKAAMPPADMQLVFVAVIL